MKKIKRIQIQRSKVISRSIRISKRISLAFANITRNQLNQNLNLNHIRRKCKSLKNWMLTLMNGKMSQVKKKDFIQTLMIAIKVMIARMMTVYLNNQALLIDLQILMYQSLMKAMIAYKKALT